ncbi:MAG: hypothetical protein KDA44_15570 [Planctomycetales bacterium]|nr:hypothetical protein [Planctomycetales bacterium]
MLRIAATLCCFLSYLAVAQGAVTFTGNVSPDDPKSWTSDEGAFVGFEFPGAVTVDGGDVLHASDLFISRGTRETGSVGRVSVDGAASAIAVDGYIRLATFGDATLSVTNGGYVSGRTLDICAGPWSAGKVTVDGEGSSVEINNGLRSGEVYVGRGGNGILSITGGATVTSYNTLIGYGHGSNGAVTVSGPGSTWINSGPLSVGDGHKTSPTPNGVGMLTISDGGTVRSFNGIIGFSRECIGTATIDGVGSTWTTEGVIDVGVFGNGRLAITGGAAVDCYLGRVGTYSPGGSGEAVVDGPGSIWTCRNGLSIGTGDPRDTGVVTISNGGTVKLFSTQGDGDPFYLSTTSPGVLHMSSGGMLALEGEADDSLEQFLELVDGTDDIRYYDRASGTWDHLGGATYGND